METTPKPKRRRQAGPNPVPVTGASKADNFDHWVGDPSFMHSLARGWLVLRAVVNGAGTPATVQQVAQATGLSVQTVRRCFYTLSALDCIRVTPAGALPASGVAAVASAYSASSPILSQGVHIIERLRDELGQQVSLATFEMGELIYLRTAYAGAAIRYSYRGMPPANCSASGKLFLAQLGDDELERYIQSHPLVSRTEHSLSTIENLRPALEEIRRRGYAIADQELDVGIRNAAVPVRDARDKVVAAITVTALTVAVGLRELRSEVIPVLVRGASELSNLTA